MKTLILIYNDGYVIKYDVKHDVIEINYETGLNRDRLRWTLKGGEEHFAYMDYISKFIVI